MHLSTKDRMLERVGGYIGVVLTGKAVQLKDVEEIVELAVDVTTHCELVALENEGSSMSCWGSTVTTHSHQVS